MKLIFNINYHTNWGESLFIVIDAEMPDAKDRNLELTMSPLDNDNWSVSVELPDDIGEFGYRYIVRDCDNGNERHEWGAPHRFIPPAKGTGTITLYDHWNDRPEGNPYYSSAFTECICARRHRDGKTIPAKGHVTIRVSAPMVKPDEVLAISGNLPAMGQWDPRHAVRMSDAGYPVWEVNIDVTSLTFPAEYKFLSLKKDSGEVSAWEYGRNRTLYIHKSDSLQQEAVVVDGLHFRTGGTPWRGAGVAIPVFSLRSEDDFGVGDFMDLKLMVDWAVRTGQKFVQLLPINDTTMTHTWRDSYPYNANSTFALHPLYLRISELGRLDDPVRQKYYDNMATELNALKEVDYERAAQGKAEFTREFFAQDGELTVNSNDFKVFVERNRQWLMPYAVFCVLRDRHNTSDFSCWGEFAVYDERKATRFAEDNAYDINYVYFIQYHLDRQMRHVRSYAHAKGVALKGDIPIGISRTSVDAWQSPQLFYLDSQAGAPPDDFSVLGQNWGFPTYNWEEMSRDGFAWWKARFRKMSEYFDAYRIDHILGFFRIWQIPLDAVHGLLGVFHPALPFQSEELRERYSFWLDPDLHASPYIMDHFLADFFGEYAEEARSRFMNPAGYGRLKLKEGFNSQRKVTEYFAHEMKTSKNERLCSGLMGLIDNVLFIEDPYEKGKYHPRITAQYSYVYRSLSDSEKWNFNRLYNDFYYHRHNEMWYGNAMWKLPVLIDATSMLTCAEDLGMIPACVPAAIHRLEILSLEIQRMPKDPSREFGDTTGYPYFSVCTTSTHDMGGIRQWWEENKEASQRFYNNVLNEPGKAPIHADPRICGKIVDLHMKSPSMLCILPLQDWLSTDGRLRRENPREEQINDPSNPDQYWQYRMHMTLEQLLAEDKFNSCLREKVEMSGRC